MKISLDHIVLNVKNVNASINFYRNVLELEIERFDQFEKGQIGFPSVRINDETVMDLFPPKMWQTNGAEGNGKVNNVNHFCFALTEQEWNRLTDRLRFFNIQITRYADNNWGSKGIGKSIYFIDPDGNEIEARYYQN